MKHIYLSQNYRRNLGFTLVELMIALVISMIIIAGSIVSYSSISQTVQTSKQLENVQEVIRSTSHILTRSLKQTSAIPLIDGTSKLIVSQDANVTACNGQTPNADFTETYSLNSTNLVCDIGNGNETILTGITNITFTLNGNSVSTVVLPIGLPDNYGNGLQIDISLTRVLFEEATAE